MSDELNNQVEQAVAPVVESEKMIPQSKVNEIVHERTREASEKAARTAYEEAKREVEQKYASMQNTQQAPQSFTLNEVREETKREMQRQMEEQRKQAEEARLREWATGVEKTYYEKMGNDPVPGGFNPADFSNIVAITTQPEFSDMMKDIIHEIAKHPQKLSSIDYLTHKSPAAAISAIREVSESIKRNKEALENKANVNSPLSQLKSSNGTTNKNADGSMSIRDFKTAFMKKRQ